MIVSSSSSVGGIVIERRNALEVAETSIVESRDEVKLYPTRDKPLIETAP